MKLKKQELVNLDKIGNSISCSLDQERRKRERFQYIMTEEVKKNHGRRLLASTKLFIP